MAGYVHFAARFGLGMMAVNVMWQFLFASSASDGSRMDGMLAYLFTPESWWTALILGVGFVVGADLIFRCMNPVVRCLVDEAVKSPGDAMRWRRLARWHNSMFMPLMGFYFFRAIQENRVTPSTISKQEGLTDRQKTQLMKIYQQAIQPCSLNPQWFRTVD